MVEKKKHIEHNRSVSMGQEVERRVGILFPLLLYLDTQHVE